MIDISKIASNIELKDGIWQSSKFATVSYPEHGNSFTFEYEGTSFWYQHRNNIIIQCINNHPPKKNIIFDFGGGNGYVTKAILNNNIEALLIEPDIKGINNAKNRGITNLLHSTFEDANFKNNTIPNIGLFDVLEHIKDDNRFLNNLYKGLSPNGKIYITVPAYQFLFSEEDTHDGHHRRYTLKKLKKLAINNGFNIEYSSYFFSILPFPILLLRTLPSLLGIKRKEDITVYQKENMKRKGIIGKILSLLWKNEIHVIRKNKSIIFGGSIIMILNKNTND